ncbi:TPR-repeat protein [Strigomonas culicis]|uniref:RNA polymerase II-associated protein 3 n=1 Tax=Strigomonas culicis TaxID=28005 RepID=S9V2L8_9TRYP|nr:TPR-repeat protein [Strigomonas culicis]|eukprot:EPY21136.1 TPR-repeat protein [Strigomonas culicis]
MQRELLGSIRQQSEDLRDELKDLEEWEDEVEKQEKEKKGRTAPSTADSVEPPIRGTVPSIKEAMTAEARKAGKKLPPDQDPIQIAKDKGNEYFRVGKTQDAIHSYTTGIDLDPHSSTSHILYGNRAMCYIKLGEWDKAEKDATTCVQMNRGYAKGFFRRAMARKNMGKLKDARADLEAVLALAPADPSALSELEIVTKMIQVERAKASGTTAPVKKKIVIEEVEDDDEEQEGADASKSAADQSQSLSPEEEKARTERISSYMEHVSRERQTQEEEARAEAEKSEKANEARRRHHPRVEIIEEEAEQAKPPPPPPKPAPAEAKKEARRAPVHQDPKTQPKEEKAKPPKKTLESAKQPTLRPRAQPTKETLTPPKSFTELERVFPEVVAHDELRNHYVGLINPAGLPALIGSNLTPEILIGLLKSVKSFPGSTAVQYLKGISKITRVNDITLFFSAEEKQLVNDVMDLAKSAGTPVAEVNAIKKKLMPF